MADVRARLRPLGLFRSTPVRLAIVLVLLFTAASIGTFGFAYVEIRRSIEKQLEASLDQRVAGFRAIEDPVTLAALVQAEAAATDPEDRVFAFLGPDGALVGNAQAELRGADVRLSRRPNGRELGDNGYATRAVPLAGGVLVVAESRAPLSDLEEVFLGLVGLSLVPTMLLSLSAAVWLALASARRVRRIEAALARLADGELSTRVGDTGRKDDLARIAAGIDRMAAAQEAATAALRQVSTDIAHDLRTPVQRLAVHLAALRERLSENSPEAAIADRAVDEAARAVDIFQSLLQIAQIEGGGPRTRFGPVDLAEVLRTLAEVYEPAAEDTGHALDLLPLPHGTVVTSGDKSLICRAVANLIENALRHTPAGSRITLGLDRGPKAVVLCVSDDGLGVATQELSNVVRRFYRLERSRTTQGHGLGLALVAAIAELHGAALALSDNAPGLRVTLAFPSNSSD